MGEQVGEQTHGQVGEPTFGLASGLLSGEQMGKQVKELKSTPSIMHS